MRNRSLHLILLCFLFPAFTAGQTVLEKYIHEGLESNLVIRSKQISVEQSLLALRTARSYFLPSIGLDAQYSLAKGGRTIDIPVGDLMNPVYQTLNQLTGSSKFPFVGNQSEQLLPNNYYDLQIRTTMPLINPEIKFNRLIQQQQVQLALNDAGLYRRELVKDIKTAYYRYLASLRAIEIYENALQVVQQNLRANLSLLANGKGLPAYVARSQSEVQTVQSQLLTAFNASKNARAYFNFLLNRPLADSILAVFPDNTLTATLEGGSAGVESREELNGVRLAKDIDELQLRMNRAYRVPRLNAFLDLAAQGYDFAVNRKAFYYLGGLQVQISLFNGNRNLNRIHDSRLNLDKRELSESEVKKQLEMAVEVAGNNLTNAEANYRAAVKQEEAANSYFRLVDRGYAEGMNSFLEYLDARNQYTNSRIRVNINFYQVLISKAELERETASYIFK